MMTSRHRGRFIKKGEKGRREKCASIACNLTRRETSEAPCVSPGSDERESTTQDDQDLTWTDGRRVVELGILADGLRACEDCGVPLNLANTETETKDGLASILYVRCECGLINSVPTSKSHKKIGGRGRPVYNVNTKAALGK